VLVAICNITYAHDFSVRCVLLFAGDVDKSHLCAEFFMPVLVAHLLWIFCIHFSVDLRCSVSRTPLSPCCWSCSASLLWEGTSIPQSYVHIWKHAVVRNSAMLMLLILCCSSPMIPVAKTMYRYHVNILCIWTFSGHFALNLCATQLGYISWYNHTNHHTVTAVPPHYTMLAHNMMIKFNWLMVCRIFFVWNCL
jgi:hypothetical protein